MSKINSTNNKSSSLTIDSSSSDSFIQHSINSSPKFRIGVDDTDDSFCISVGSALGTSNALKIHSDGNINKSLTPCFSAVASNQNNVTGNYVSYTVTFTGSEYFDQNSDFDGTSVFTAPKTGIYLFTSSIKVSGLTSAFTSMQHTLLCTGSNPSLKFIGPGKVYTPSTTYSSSFVHLRAMTAGDTASSRVYVASSTQTIDIIGADSYFNGYLVC